MFITCSPLHTYPYSFILMQLNLLIFLCVCIYFFHSSTCSTTTALKIEETRIFCICNFIFVICLSMLNTCTIKGRVLRRSASFFTTRLLFFTNVFLFFSQVVNYFFRFVTFCFFNLIDQQMINCRFSTNIRNPIEFDNFLIYIMYIHLYIYALY